MRLLRFGATLIASVPAFAFRSHFRVHGDSMRPGLLHGDLLHVLPRSWTPRGFQRGAVVVAMSPAERGVFWVKRVIGLPGEFVWVADDGRVFIDDVPLPNVPSDDVLSDNVPARDALESEPYRAEAPARAQGSPPWLCDHDEYFLMGDNRADSNDSRRYGPAPFGSIVGRVWLRWPMRRGAPIRGRAA